MNPYAVVFLDVLPGGLAQVEADYAVVGLHPRGDGTEPGVVDGANADDGVCPIAARTLNPLWERACSRLRRVSQQIWH